MRPKSAGHGRVPRSRWVRHSTTTGPLGALRLGTLRSRRVSRAAFGPRLSTLASDIKYGDVSLAEGSCHTSLVHFEAVLHSVSDSNACGSYSYIAGSVAVVLGLHADYHFTRLMMLPSLSAGGGTA